MSKTMDIKKAQFRIEHLTGHSSVWTNHNVIWHCKYGDNIWNDKRKGGNFVPAVAKYTLSNYLLMAIPVITILSLLFVSSLMSSGITVTLILMMPLAPTSFK